jgi:cholesterol oxidase
MWHGWRATTTLPCRLHAGADPSAPVVGAGILRLSPAAFAAQLLSFATLHATSIGDRLRARVVFLRLFSGELIDTYLWRAPVR